MVTSENNNKYANQALTPMRDASKTYPKQAVQELQHIYDNFQRCYKAIERIENKRRYAVCWSNLMCEMPQSYHAHIYYDVSSFEQASKLCDEVGALFDVLVGFKHKKLVGPHPMWSCQISLTAEKFAEVVPWLMLNRQGLTVFIHGNTGDDFKDHTEHTMWMGSIEPLNLDIFKEALIHS